MKRTLSNRAFNDKVELHFVIFDWAEYLLSSWLLQYVFTFYLETNTFKLNSLNTEVDLLMSGFCRLYVVMEKIIIVVYIHLYLMLGFESSTQPRYAG